MIGLTSKVSEMRCLVDSIGSLIFVEILIDVNSLADAHNQAPIVMIVGALRKNRSSIKILRFTALFSRRASAYRSKCVHPPTLILGQQPVIKNILRYHGP